MYLELEGQILKNDYKYVFKYLSTYSIGSKVSHIYTLWLASLNIVLIVLVNPSILNPGPGTPPNITIFYQNVRGLIPFTELGKPSPMLDYTKLFELQSYVLYNKIDIVVLNESWLMKDINNNEIFPNGSYKFFRVDRSPLTHPSDPNNPKNIGGTVVVC